MQALAIIDMQRWMFRLPERAAQLPALVPAIDRLEPNLSDFIRAGDRPIKGPPYTPPRALRSRT
jgi:hypothetical protein